MKRQITYLDKAQAKAVVQIFRRGQLGDLAVFLKIDSKNKNGQYRLCLDLLNEGYTVYCIDDTLKEQCDDRIIFNPAPIDPVCWIDL